jgi:hypothetical protein
MRNGVEQWQHRLHEEQCEREREREREGEGERGVGEKGKTVRDYTIHNVHRSASLAIEHK